jgi:methionine-rich copper-binding protein CopC
LSRRPLAALCTLAVAVALALPAGAHTQVKDARPGPGETASGTVDEVRISFVDPVLPTPTIEVTGPDGEPVPGLEPAELDGDDAAVARFDPLVAAGRYQVSYDYASLDGFPQSGAHEFRFDPEGEGGGTSLRLVLGAVGVLLVAGFALAALRTRRRST